MHSNEPVLLQDTSTQAMTEVALGLSMAFFALLIIALMSVAMPSQAPSNTVLSEEHDASQYTDIDTKDTVELALQSSTKSSTTLSKAQKDLDKSRKATANNASSSMLNSDGEPITILLYWDGSFFNTQQQIVNISDVESQKDVIVAVSPQLAFKQLMTIQNQFKGDKMRLTTLSPAWQKRLDSIN